jgi:hypothetical protein
MALVSGENGSITLGVKVETLPQSVASPLQPPAVDIDPTTGWVVTACKLKPVGVPFDASPQFGAEIVTEASWTVIGPESDRTHGSLFGCLTWAIAVAPILTVENPSTAAR